MGKFQLLVNVKLHHNLVMDDHMSNRFLSGHKSVLKIAALLCA